MVYGLTPGVDISNIVATAMAVESATWSQPAHHLYVGAGKLEVRNSVRVQDKIAEQLKQLGISGQRHMGIGMMGGMGGGMRGGMGGMGGGMGGGMF